MNRLIMELSWIQRRENLSGSSLSWSLLMKQVDELIVLGLGVTQLPQCFPLKVTERICFADYLGIMQAQVRPKVRGKDIYIT